MNPIRWSVAALACAAALAFFAPSASAAREIYVSASTGSNSNEGTKDAPKKQLWRVMGDLQEGDVIRVAEGTYASRGKSGVLPKIETPNVTLEGGWKADFSERDPFRFLTIISPPGDAQGEGKTVFHAERSDGKLGGVVIDGFCVDRGPGNYYYSDGEPGANQRIEGHQDNSAWGYQALNRKKSGSDPTVVLIGRQGGFVVRNMLLINNPWWAIYIKAGGEGECRIENNLVLGARSRAVEAITGGGWGKPTWIIRNNSVLFTHTEGSDGRALSIDPRQGQGRYVVERNVLAFSQEGGVTIKFAAKGDSLALEDNLFFLNRKGDYNMSGKPLCNAADFEDELEIDAMEGNVHELPAVTAKLAKAWVDRWSQNGALTLDGFAAGEEVMAARTAAGLAEYHLHGYDKTYAGYDELPDERPNYSHSRYPHPMKKGELIDWQAAVLPLVGADGTRGVQAFSAAEKGE